MMFEKKLDKQSEQWKQAPFWVKISLWTINSRNVAIGWEIFTFAAGVIGFIASLFYPPLALVCAIFAAAYWYAISIRWVDNAGLW